MKTYTTVALCGLTALVSSVFWGLGPTWAQPPRTDDSLAAPVRVPMEARTRVDPMPAHGVPPVGPYAAKFITTVHPEAMHEIRHMAQQLSEAEDDDAKAEAEEKLSELLDNYFEEDMKRREQELADVEARVKKLRELMERRRAKKDDIIDLQKEVLVNEVEGLGFFNGGGPGGPQLPPGHPFVGGGTIRSEGGDVFRFAVPPPPGGEWGGASGAKVFLKERKRRVGEKPKKPADYRPEEEANN